MVGETVNNTEAVWLNNMKDQGASVDIEGMALSADAVANLISNLQKTGYFRNIEIKESIQDDTIKDMQAFQFTLTCEKGEVLKRRNDYGELRGNVGPQAVGGVGGWSGAGHGGAVLTPCSRAQRDQPMRRRSRSLKPSCERTPSWKPTVRSWRRSSVSWPA